MARLDEISKPPLFPALVPEVEVDERAARVSLRRQIVKLERDLSATLVESFPHGGCDVRVGTDLGGPRLLTLGDLEVLRDALDARLRDARGDLIALAERREEARLMLERMLLEPGRYKWARIDRQDLGEHGCGQYHVRPRLGVIGMLAGWWHVKVSSGCPLARAAAPCAVA